MKTCKTCHQPLPLDEFYESETTVDRLMGDCKLCLSDKRDGREAAIKQQQVDHEAAQYLARHEARRIEEARLAEQLQVSRHERARIEPLTFAGVVEPFFRSERRSFKWRIA